jgi:hypothetical protein
MPLHRTFLNRERAVTPALLDGCHGMGVAAGTSEVTASGNSISDRDIIALRGQAVNIATTSLRYRRPNLRLGGISAHSAQNLVSSSS